MKARARFSATATALAALACSGCTSMLSGVGGTDHYACKAPQGAQCTSVSGVYANSIAQSRPAAAATTTTTPPAPAPTPSRPWSAAPPAYGAQPSTTAVGAAGLRSAPRVLRLWIAPWEDADGDLHEEAYVHVVVDHGHWIAGHLRAGSTPRLHAVTPPVQEPSKPAAPAAPASGPQPGRATGQGKEG